MTTRQGEENANAVAEGLKAILRNNYIADETKQDAARRLQEDESNAEKLSQNEREEVAKWADLKVRDFAYEPTHN
ncbi:hypothetical protein HDZ31DRAFT_69090 [Schizophyllum fasciatum]